jgi:cytoplasmic iron level regulating protein YaaA (DUF328/UPF0246 family)
MLVLLPPSEGKTAPVTGDPVDLGSLAFPSLNKTRERLINVLARLGSGPRALAALGISPGLVDEAARNAVIREAPAAPAASVYTGVLYEHLGLGELPGENVLIASALWGFVRPSDRIPAYRLSIGAKLPRIPTLAGLWREPLRRALPDEGLIVDMRSGGYAAAWKPKHATVVGVRAFAGGQTISHMVKATRGDVARILLTGPEPATPDEVLARVREAGLDANLSGHNLDVQLPAAPSR